MDFLGWLSDWWQSVEPRTDWLAIVAGFFGTMLGTIIAVLIALRIQRDDFAKRVAEAAEQNAADARLRRLDLGERKRELSEQSEADARLRRDDWRRAIMSRAFEVLQRASMFGTFPNKDRNDWQERQAQIAHAIHSLQIEFRADPEPGGAAVGNWYRRSVEGVMRPHDDPAKRAAHVDGLSARVRSDLGEWAAGERPNNWFESR